MTRASNWDEIIRATHVMVRFLFNASLWVLLLVCDVLMGAGGEDKIEHSRLVATREASECC